MKFCTYCGSHINNQNAHFCENCGAVLNNNNNNNKNNNNNGKIDINNLPDEQTLKKMIENGEIDQNTMKELEKLGKLPAPPKK